MYFIKRKHIQQMHNEMCTFINCNYFCSVIEVYHKCEVCATTRYRKGVIYLYKKYEELLKKTGKTSYQVSKDTGIGQNTLSGWKTGRSQPKWDKLLILAKYFGVSIEYFLEDTSN